MFHQGTLQSGISRAIQEQKLVACFVRDDSEESTTWEKEWLQSGWLSSLLEQKAVLLRLDAGSTEAGFLSAFCPVSVVPTFIVINNGQLQDQLVKGVDQNEFINRIRKVLGAEPIPGTTQPSDATPLQASSTPVSTPAEAQAPPPIEPTPPPSAPAPAPVQEDERPLSSIPPPSSKSKGKQKATPPNPKRDATSSTNAAQQAARDALRKKKQEEKDELERIRARIEADKVERKAQAAAQKAERELERQTASSTTSSPAPTTTGNRRSMAKQVSLNVRLFDGRTIRSTFPRDAKLQDDVRPWIDQEFASEDPNAKHPPYFFKQILAPLPSRELSAGEESETLGDIDLAPSATLVLVPVKGYTEAYSGGGGGGVVGGVVGGVSGLVGGAFGLAYNAVGYVGSTLGSIVGYGSGPSNPEAQPAPAATEGRMLSETRPETPNSATIRVRTLADQRTGDTRSQEFYNGNSLDFEPNEDGVNRR